MAAIGRIRQHSGLLIAIIGIALAAFVLGDLFKSGGGRRQNVPVAVVDGEEINYSEFSAQAEKNLENQRLQSRDGKLDDRQAFTIRQQTYEQMVRNILMNERYNDLGITVTTEELADLVQGKNPHPVIVNNFTDPQTGQFDANLVRQFISNLSQMDRTRRAQWLDLENYIRDDRENQKFNNLIAKAYYMPNALAEVSYTEKGTTANIDYFGVKYQSISDEEIEITEADYKAYYEENKHRFKSDKEECNVEYIVFDVKASKQDIDAIKSEFTELQEELAETALEDVPQLVNATSDVPYTDRWLAKGQLPPRIESNMFEGEPGEIVGPYIENNKYHLARLLETTMRPDSMKASHILIAYQGAARSQSTRTALEAKAYADSLYNVLKKKPGRFAEMAKTFSDGPSSTKGGDLGWFADGAMATNFNESVINTPKGKLDMAETQFGFHIIKVTGKKKPVKKVKVAQIEREINPSSQTFQQEYMKASAFAGENTKYEDFENTVEEKGLNKRSSGYFDAIKYTIPGIAEPRQIIRWAFNEDTKIGDVSKVFEDGEKFIVATLTDHREAGYLPLEEVKTQIEPLVKREKKAEKIIAKINDKTGDFRAKAAAMGAEMMHYDDLRMLSYNLKGFGREIETIGKIFTIEEGATSEPIQGNMAVYIVKMNKVNQPNALTNYEGTKTTMEQSFQRNVARIYESIKESADIEDNTIIAF